MIRLDLNSFEQNDIIQYLKYAKEQKEEESYFIEKGKFTTVRYDINRIEQLIQIVSGKTKKDYLLQNNSYKEDINSKRDYYIKGQKKEKDYEVVKDWSKE